MNDKNDIRGIVNRIAGHLPGWILNDGPRSGTCYLRGPGNTQVLVSWYDDGKLQFGVSPEPGLRAFESMRPERPSCKIIANRDPAAAARDIKRRCLDSAIPYIRALRERRAASDARDAERWANLETLRAAIDGELHKPYGDNPVETVIGRGAYGNPRVRIELAGGHVVSADPPTYGPDQVTMALDGLSLALALDLCAWLQKRLWLE